MYISFMSVRLKFFIPACVFKYSARLFILFQFLRICFESNYGKNLNTVYTKMNKNIVLHIKHRILLMLKVLIPALAYDIILCFLTLRAWDLSSDSKRLKTRFKFSRTRHYIWKADMLVSTNKKVESYLGIYIGWHLRMFLVWRQLWFFLLFFFLSFFSFSWFFFCPWQMFH